MQREDLIRLAREAVGGVHRPSYCDNPASFDPHEWVLEAMKLAYGIGAVESCEPELREALRGMLDQFGEHMDKQVRREYRALVEISS